MTSSKIRASTSATGSKGTVNVIATSVPKTSVPLRKKTVFQVQAKPGSKVFLAGDFNNWDCLKKELLDKDGSGFYQGAIVLPPGTYEYKFVINGTWCIDPGNSIFRPNRMGTLNSVIVVE